MRITTQMLNESARRAKLPVNQNSLLDHLQDRSKENRLAESLQSQKAAALLSGMKKYEEQEEHAGELAEKARELAAQGEESIYRHAQEKESTAEIVKKIEEMAGLYNDTLSGFLENGGALNDFYRQSLEELVGKNRTALESIGLTAGKNGELSVDKKILRAADAGQLEKVFAGEDGFADMLSELASKIADNAAAGRKSAWSGYQAGGSESAAGAYPNRYEFCG